MCDMEVERKHRGASADRIGVAQTDRTVMDCSCDTEFRIGVGTAHLGPNESGAERILLRNQAVFQHGFGVTQSR